MNKSTQDRVLSEIEAKVKTTINAYYKQWDALMTYKSMLVQHGRKAKSVGIGLGELAEMLVKNKVVTEVYGPTGARFFMPYDEFQKLTSEEVMAKILIMEELKQSLRVKHEKP